MGMEAFKSYFSFSFVRNPWDWQTSLYEYALTCNSHHQHNFVKNLAGFDDYIRWRCTQEVRYQRDFIYSQDGAQLVDYVGRFERLEEDFGLVCSRFGVTASLPRLRISKKKPYQCYYNAETRALVSRVFEPDIRLFNYTFS